MNVCMCVVSRASLLTNSVVRRIAQYKWKELYCVGRTIVDGLMRRRRARMVWRALFVFEFDSNIEFSCEEWAREL